MNRLIPILVYLSLLLIGVLFFILFSGNNETEKNQVVEDELTEPAQEIEVDKIVVVNLDTLSTYYNFYTDTRKKLESRTAQLERDFKSREASLQKEGEALQKKLLEYQQKAQEGQLDQFEYIKAQDELEKGQKTLLGKEESYLRYKEKMTSQLVDDERSMSLELNQKIVDFLDRYSMENGHELVLSYTFGANVLYNRKEHDITRNVLEQLNAEYAGELSSKTE